MGDYPHRLVPHTTTSNKLSMQTQRPEGRASGCGPDLHASTQHLQARLTRLLGLVHLGLLLLLMLLDSVPQGLLLRPGGGLALTAGGRGVPHPHPNAGRRHHRLAQRAAGCCQAASGRSVGRRAGCRGAAPHEEGTVHGVVACVCVCLGLVALAVEVAWAV